MQISKSSYTDNDSSDKKLLIVVPKAFLPQLTGGLEVSANEIAQLYIQQGFDVHVAAGFLGRRVNRLFERVRRKLYELPRAKAFRLGSNSLREEGYLN